MLLLLMMQLEKLEFIALEINMMCLILLRSGNIWMIMIQEKCLNVLNLIMEVNTAVRRFTVTVHTMGFVERNAMSERMNRMIMERARCMILHVGFPL